MHVLENKVPPPLVALVFAAGMWGVALAAPSFVIEPKVKYSVVFLLCSTGAVFVLSGINAFRRARTTVNPLKPESSTTLVTSGIYRITRNPMYVGLATFLLAWSVYLGSAWAICLVLLNIAYIHRFQVIPEERAMEKLFGQEFTNYKARVRPWL